MANESSPPTQSPQAPAAEAPVPASQLAAWKDKHGDVFGVDVDGQTFVFRKPRWTDVSRFADGCIKSVADASLTLVLDTMLSPTAEAFAALMAAKPALPMILVAKVQEMAGEVKAGDVKKL